MLFALLLLILRELALDEWRVAYRDGRVEAGTGASALAAIDRSQARSIWVWSEARAPRQVREDEGAAEGRREPDPPLVVRVVGVPEKEAAQARVVSAPLAMWLDLPEDRLPHWPVPRSGALTVPHDPGQRWRLRLIGATVGSWWIDVEPGARTAMVAAAGAATTSIAVEGPGGAPAGAVEFSALTAGPRQRGRALALGRDDAGRVELRALPDLQPLLVVVTAPGYPPLVLEGRAGDFPSRVRLTAGASLGGVVVGADVRPMPGAKVEIETWTAAGVAQVRRFVVATKGDGTWRVDGLPPGEQVAVTFRAPGLATVRSQVRLDPGANDFGVVRLEAPAALAVEVVDDRGEPVAGARVVTGAAEAATDAAGRAELAVVATDAVKVGARAEGHLSTLETAWPPFTSVLRLELRRAFVVTGRLLDAAGNPPRGGVLETRCADSSQEHALGEDGAFRVAVEPAATVDLLLRSRSTRELALQLAPGEPGETRDLGDLRAPGDLMVKGRVVEAATGAGYAAARVWVPRPGPHGMAIAWAAGDVLETWSGEGGTFTLPGLGPGPALLRVDAPGFARAQVQVTLREDEPITDLGEVELARGTQVRLLVDVPEIPSGTMAQADLVGDWRDADLLWAPVRDGVAVFRDVPPGRARFAVFGGRKLLCERIVTVEAAATGLDVPCEPGGLLVSGVVRLGKAPSGAGTLIWLPAAGSTTASRIDNRLSPAGLRQQQVSGLGRPQVDVAVGADGSFASRDLRPGAWSVLWAAPGGWTTSSLPVELPEVERYEAVLEFAGNVVSGQVLDADGQPAPEARVRDLTGGGFTVTDDDGRFTLAGLAGERALLQARRDDQTSAIQEVDPNRTDGAAPIVLRLGDRDTSQLVVHVVAVDGTPASGAFVFLDERGRGIRVLTADAHGRATATLEAPLPDELRLAATNGAGWALGGWRPWALAQEPMTIGLEPAGRLEVRSSAPAGQLSLVSETGWDVGVLLRLLGIPLSVEPESQLSLGAVPGGRYTVSIASGETRHVALAPGGAAQLSFD